jgi:hypothetical protein
LGKKIHEFKQCTGRIPQILNPRPSEKNEIYERETPNINIKVSGGVPFRKRTFFEDPIKVQNLQFRIGSYLNGLSKKIQVS